MIAPPFYAVQIDIAMGFKAKHCNLSLRKTFQVYALVVVCLLTSATNVLALDGLSTATVVQALERHASRYGVPASVYVDSGTQLEKLQDASFKLRDVESRMRGGSKFKLTVATPKAHQAQGRVESKVKQVRTMLQKLSDTTYVSNTWLGWETLFARIANELDNLPIARGGAKAATDLGWEIITPNRLKLGRNNFRQLEGEIVLSDAPQLLLTRNRQIQKRWYEIFFNKLHLLIPKPEPPRGRKLQPGDIVLFVVTDAGSKRMWEWRLGVIERIVSRTTYEVRYAGIDEGPPRTLLRSAREMSLILPVDELPLTHPDFFKDLDRSSRPVLGSS
jgi:hypothetical protein